MHAPTRFRFATAWLPEGWKNDVVIGIDDAGNIDSLVAGDRSTQALSVAGAAIPGMPNVHSHAFQRAMAGLAEHRSTAQDSFWTWRETMYALAGRITPELLNVIAAQLYVEMLKAGYTTVCEFHYLHRQAQAAATNEMTMSQAVLDAAAATGIGMTLLPTLYQTSGFGGAAPTLRQQQFVCGVDSFVQLIDQLQRECVSPQAAIGAAIHSLRAVPAAALQDVLRALASRNPAALHIHIAEQEREVEECVQHTGRRPIEWLLEHAVIDQRWCLVHATHASSQELDAIAGRGAVVALCPTTEANLGDGRFALEEFIAAGGAIAIGSDSHISVSAVEELRWLEYQARLRRGQRNVFASASSDSTGAALWRLACAGGAQASGRAVGALQEGRRADIVVLDLDSPVLIGRTDDAIMDTFVFAGQPNPVRDVMVGGRWLVQDGHHFAEIPIAAAYRRALRALA
ncbi:MAG TPA: formimidoylglutamate deiminase [Povalibacter sp.]